ncbi:MAG: hypothetical protein PGN27_25120 [Mycolicibacterium neoaurum]
MILLMLGVVFLLVLIAVVQVTVAVCYIIAWSIAAIWRAFQ